MKDSEISTVEFIMAFLRSCSEEQIRSNIQSLGGKDLLLQDMEEHKREIQSEIDNHNFILNKLIGNKQIIESIIDNIKNV